MECEVVAELRVRPPLPPPDFFVMFKCVYANAKSFTQLGRTHLLNWTDWSITEQHKDNLQEADEWINRHVEGTDERTKMSKASGMTNHESKFFVLPEPSFLFSTLRSTTWTRATSFIRNNRWILRLTFYVLRRNPGQRRAID